MGQNRSMVLLRHGQSEWNKMDLFTGWEDVDLSPQGKEEARRAGELLKKHQQVFDEVHCSQLKRAIKTAWIALEEMQHFASPLFYHWRLNERHYGDLQGKNKTQMKAEYGEDQVKIWRRSYSVLPPLKNEYQQLSYHQKLLGLQDIPKAESLKLTVERVIPYWNDVLSSKVKMGKRLLIAAHGNSLRALIKHLEGISEEEIIKLEIPTGKPIQIIFDETLRVISRDYLS